MNVNIVAISHFANYFPYSSEEMIHEEAMSFMTPKLFCSNCGRFHGRVAHGKFEHMHFSSLIAANTNFEQEVEPAVRKRISAREAMAVTKERYKETLEYLS
ncbi:hypothetical protein [Thalassovita sp.]|uniref:hypothetical protein n=1 Tax=Thalassovita sp. TaxID=1979401 RepID=UPI002B2728D0|nr:hypothetical protein [Thalassovita sp.]